MPSEPLTDAQIAALAKVNPNVPPICMMDIGGPYGSVTCVGKAPRYMWNAYGAPSFTDSGVVVR